MGDVINLGRFRKKKAREEKEKRADLNRRLHGRTKAERASDEAAKSRLEKKLNGAFLLRETVGSDEIPGESTPDFAALEDATRDVMTLSELSAEVARVKDEVNRLSGQSDLCDESQAHASPQEETSEGSPDKPPQ